MKATDIARVRRELLAFYDAHRRDLPWRRDTHPYRVWVSEIMLQQTRVETAIPYYERWLDRFPTLAALADAELDDVLKAWEGLGYYTRARNLHRAARTVRDRYGGEVPADAETLRTLPGVGEYTAGAIASIAFGRREPAVDGNVRRVIARLLDEPDPGPAAVREMARALVPDDRPGDFNQALMELGATVCTSRAPRCAVCPIHRACAARAAGTQEQRPAAKAARTIPTYTLGTLVLTDGDGRVLLEKRPDSGLLAGLWSFPGRAVAHGRSGVAAARRVARDLLGGRRLGRLTEIGEVAHVFSHRREVYTLFRGRIRGRTRAHRPSRWVTVTELEALALPSAQRRIARAARLG